MRDGGRSSLAYYNRCSAREDEGRKEGRKATMEFAALGKEMPTIK